MRPKKTNKGRARSTDPKKTKSVNRGYKATGPKKLAPKVSLANDDGKTRLNKFLANSGICSRREADKFIAEGLVTVNGEVVIEMGVKVSPTDIVKYAGENLKFEKLVYILLNKPKDTITTLDDPKGRKTVLDVIGKACKERVYPVGRLDRDTTGLLLLTNDGDITKKLTHPKHGVKKIYHAVLDKKVAPGDLKQITNGVDTEVGYVTADVAAYVGDGSDRTQVGIEIHSGKNRVVRRMFEALNYKVTKLDRVLFAGLTKKNLPRGKWRFLDEKEVGMLKMLG